MKTTAEMIAVMQAYERGESIEVRHSPFDCWNLCKKPTWSWNTNEYRIAKKKVKLYQALCKNEHAKSYISALLYRNEEDAEQDIGENFIRLLYHTEVEVEADK